VLGLGDAQVRAFDDQTVFARRAFLHGAGLRGTTAFEPREASGVPPARTLTSRRAR
jgi:hypothetical protein